MKKGAGGELANVAVPSAGTNGARNFLYPLFYLGLHYLVETCESLDDMLSYTVG